MVTKIRVRKMYSGANYRFRYAHQGVNARKKGDYTIKGMEALNGIEFSFNDNITDKERKTINNKWSHKIIKETL